MACAELDPGAPGIMLNLILLVPKTKIGYKETMFVTSPQPTLHPSVLAAVNQTHHML